MIIRRPLALITLAFVLGIGSYYIFNPTKYLYFAGLFFFVLAFGFFLIFGNKAKGESAGTAWNGWNDKYSKITNIIIISILVFNIGGIGCDKAFNKSDGMDDYYDTEVTYNGHAIKYQQKKNDFYKITVRNGRDKYLLYVYGEGLNEEDIIGSNIYYRGNAKEPAGRRNPGGFDYQLYLKSININTIIECDVEDLKTIKPRLISNPLMFFYKKLTEVKCNYLERIQDFMSPESHGILNGILFGNKDDMDEDMYEAFQKNGIAHILSVSGIHVGIVYAFIFMLLGRRLNFRISIILFIFIFIYAFLAQFSPSVVRASIMIIIHIISKLIHRPYDLLTGSSLAGLLMLIHSPLSLFNVGFQLSFLAIILLAFMIPFLSRFVGEKKVVGAYKARFKEENNEDFLPDKSSLYKKIINSLLPLIVIQGGMAPFTAFVFSHFSVAGIFLNIPIIFMAGVLIPLGIILIPFSLLPAGPLTNMPLLVGGKILDIALNLIIEINDSVFSMIFSSFHVVSPPGWLLILFYGLLIFFSSEAFRILKNRRMKKPLAAMVAGILVVAILCSFSQVCVWDDSQVVFIDVGQGDAIHLRTPSGKNVLIDGGGSVDYNVGKNVLLPYFLKNGVKKVDYAFVTHLHTDHFQGLKELSNYIDVDHLITYEGSKVKVDEITSGSGLDSEDIVFVGGGDNFAIDDGINMDILYPNRRSRGEYVKALEFEEDENSNSLLMKLNYKNSSILITGDLGEEGERTIISELNNPSTSLKSTVLKVGHHGSKYSTSQEFLDYVNPDYGVIQVSEKNTYGHPAPQVIEKLEEKDIMIYRNDLDGAVMLKYEVGKDGGRFKLMTMINDNNRRRQH